MVRLLYELEDAKMATKKQVKGATSEFRIVKGVPLPGRGRKPGVCKYPFATMAVGDVFFLPVDEKTRKRTQWRLANAAYSFGKFHEMKFALRGLPDNRIGVWRIE